MSNSLDTLLALRKASHNQYHWVHDPWLIRSDGVAFRANSVARLEPRPDGGWIGTTHLGDRIYISSEDAKMLFGVEPPNREHPESDDGAPLYEGGGV